jgi:excisionase family DNA binding protein
VEWRLELQRARQLVRKVDTLKQTGKKEHSSEAMRLFTLREVAEYLKVHPGTVYRLVKNGQLPAARIGRDLRFDPRLVQQWVAEGGTGARGGKSRA